jgi:hypothetical protein
LLSSFLILSLPPAIRATGIEPVTIADGVRILILLKFTFQCTKKLNELYEISEEEIIYRTNCDFITDE